MLSKDQTLGKYQILDRLGSGGFGAVYLAMDTWVNRKVALKVPHQQQDEIVDLLKEPRIMAGLKHPNIVELITVERKNGIFFMVLEYVEGESLDRMIRRERTLPPTRALEIGLDVCSAIAFAHGHQILHRDLRPANILVNREGVAKVTDFGTSRVLEMQHVPYAPTRIGSPPYMAPEHFRGRAVFQSDLWSLGITLYEMLTGHVAFPGKTIPDTLAGVLEREPDWALLPATTPPAIHRLLERCLEKDARRRVRDIGDIANELSDATTSPANVTAPRSRARRVEVRLPPVPVRSAAGQPGLRPSPAHSVRSPQVPRHRPDVHVPHFQKACEALVHVVRCTREVVGIGDSV